MLMFWGSHSQENGIACRRCGVTWVHRRRYRRTPRGRAVTVSRLVLSKRREAERVGERQLLLK
jgi:hypothetical protein